MWTRKKETWFPDDWHPEYVLVDEWIPQDWVTGYELVDDQVQKDSDSGSEKYKAFGEPIELEEEDKHEQHYEEFNNMLSKYLSKKPKQKTNYVVYENSTSNKELQRSTPLDAPSLSKHRVRDTRRSTLEIDTDSIEVHHVKSVKFTSENHQVRRERNR